MPQNYTPEFKKKIVRLHLEEGRTYKSITAEYGVAKATISKWCSEFSKECQNSPQAQNDYDSMRENLQLKKENEELRKEVMFLKKRWHSLQRRSISGVSVYRTTAENIWLTVAAPAVGYLSE